jgi:cytochrome c556
MTKKEEFKKFASENKHLSKLVQEGKTTWQKLFETFDIYGADNSVWSEYKETKRVETKSTDGIKNILGNLKNIDMDKLEENITSLQKALGFLEEIVISRSEKKEEKATHKKKSTEIERFFDD